MLGIGKVGIGMVCIGMVSIGMVGIGMEPRPIVRRGMVGRVSDDIEWS